MRSEDSRDRDASLGQLQRVIRQHRAGTFAHSQLSL